MRLSAIHTVYFLGIGGIGMSALARYFRHLGAEVHGYDRTKTPLTETLEAEGMHIHYTENAALIPDPVDLVVWTPAIPEGHAELQWLRARGIRLYKRAEVLGLISRDMRCVAVAGTHGKTTTTTLCSHLLRECGVDVSAFLGGISLNLGSNYAEGHSKWVVVEADEYDRSFLHLHPEIAVLNSVDPDHLDIYGTPEAVVQAYEQFVGQIREGGVLLYKNGLDIPEGLQRVRTNGALAVPFGVGAAGLEIAEMFIRDQMQGFVLRTGPEWPAAPVEHLSCSIRFPGRHNVENAAAAAGVALLLGARPEQVALALSAFKGVKRRFEYLLEGPEVYFIDDYAHHPAELRATILAAKELFANKRITGLFQPHLYSRTRDFADDFARALDLLDECLLLPIYPAREEPIPGVDSGMILKKMTLENRHLLTKAQVEAHIQTNKPEVLLMMGAGDIDALAGPLVGILSGKNRN